MAIFALKAPPSESQRNPPLAADLYITRAAKYMVERHGEQAWPLAVGRAKDLLARSQKEASLIWFEIAREIVQLRHGSRNQAGRK